MFGVIPQVKLKTSLLNLIGSLVEYLATLDRIFIFHFLIVVSIFKWDSVINSHRGREGEKRQGMKLK